MGAVVLSCSIEVAAVGEAARGIDDVACDRDEDDAVLGAKSGLENAGCGTGERCVVN